MLIKVSIVDWSSCGRGHWRRSGRRRGRHGGVPESQQIVIFTIHAQRIWLYLKYIVTVNVLYC